MTTSRNFVDSSIPAVDGDGLQQHVVAEGQHEPGEAGGLAEGAHDEGLRLLGPEVGGARLLEAVSAAHQHVDHKVGAVVLLRHLAHKQRWK